MACTGLGGSYIDYAGHFSHGFLLVTNKGKLLSLGFLNQVDSCMYQPSEKTNACLCSASNSVRAWLVQSSNIGPQQIQRADCYTKRHIFLLFLGQDLTLRIPRWNILKWKCRFLTLTEVIKVVDLVVYKE